MRYVLDTNALVAALKNDPRVRRRIDPLPCTEVGLPLLALGELLYGAARSARPAENRASIARLRAAMSLLPITEATVERYATTRAALEARGRRKEDFDLVIACTALEHGATLVTNDGALKDGAIEGLIVEDWIAEGAP